MLYWNADPEALRVGAFAIRWYGLFFATAFALGLRLMSWMYARENRSQDELDSLLLYVVAGTVLGARLGHCLFYDPVFYLGNPLEILKIWEGGLASHGGVVGLVVAAWLFRRQPGGPDLLWLLDRVAIPGALGGMCIRLGNFMNSEIVGLPTNVSWAVVFERVDGLPRHPVQLYEAVAYALIFVALFGAYRRGAGQRRGLLTGSLLALVFAARFGLEFFKTPQESFALQGALNLGQWLSVPCVLAGLYLMWRAWSSRSRR